MQRHFGFASALLAPAALLACLVAAGQMEKVSLDVLAPIIQDNLAVFPVVTGASPDTSRFLALDEGIRSNQVVITESGSAGLVRPRTQDPGPVWREHPLIIPFPRPPVDGARVNELALVNNSDRPLILLAGEIVTGGKQDRVVGKDRIVPPHSEPIALGVFCVEPHRWIQTSADFGSLPLSFAQPSVRREAMANQNQEQVWAEVGKFRAGVAAAVPQADAFSSSSYARAVQSVPVQKRLDSVAVPIEHSYDRMLSQLRNQKAVGAVVAVNGEIIWADVFASSSLLEKYWPKLVRSYAAEAMTPSARMLASDKPATLESAKAFLNRLESNHEEVDTEPNLYRSTQYHGDSFDAFFLTSLLPNTGYVVHMAKMKTN